MMCIEKPDSENVSTVDCQVLVVRGKPRHWSSSECTVMNMGEWRISGSIERDGLCSHHSFDDLKTVKRVSFKPGESHFLSPSLLTQQ